MLQFTLGVGLIIASTVYLRQMNFIAQYNPGFDMHGIAEIDMPAQRVGEKTVHAFRDELAREPGVINMAQGYMVPIDGAAVTAGGNKLTASVSWVDTFFLPTLGMQLREGRNFFENGDSAHSVIVNETFINEAGLKNPVGMQIIMTDGIGVERTRTIVGVVKDYHYNSLKERVAPLVLEPDGYKADVLWIKIKDGQVPRVLAAIQKTYSKIFPEHYYQYSFLDEENAAQYANDQRWKQIIMYAASLAILICCTGLFGLAHFAAQQRVKEIGIRKVLGATVANITALLSKDFLLLVMLAIIIASPIAWYCMHTWIENFAYRITIGWQVFSIAGVTSLSIALCTVGYQAIKAARQNPVESLRAE